MTKLLIATVFGPTKRNRTWLNLQTRFLSQTTKEYKQVAFLNGTSKKLDIEVLGRSKQNLGHPEALTEVFNLLKETKYDQYLLLDSDAFPVWPGWQSTLMDHMNQNGVQIAAPIRLENLDQHAHPCTIFMTGKGLHETDWHFQLGGQTNLMGQKIKAFTLGEFPFLPMVRTNVYNPHPIWGGVYNHMFYHHGAGSRHAHTRATKAGIFDHFLSDEDHERIARRMFKALKTQPEHYIGKLLGLR